MRWPIEQCFNEAKDELGMDHYEFRSWTAWHRHMLLVFIASAFLLEIRLLVTDKDGLVLGLSFMLGIIVFFTSQCGSNLSSGSKADLQQRLCRRGANCADYGACGLSGESTFEGTKTLSRCRGGFKMLNNLDNR
ncbi:MAG: hypothetical protein ACYCVD_10535 [Desulfitobacteriaceae bacterium]